MLGPVHMEVGDPGRWGSPPTHGQDKVGLHMKSRGAEVLFKRYRVVANSEKQTKMADGRHFVVVNASFTFIGIFSSSSPVVWINADLFNPRKTSTLEDVLRSCKSIKYC